MIGFYYFFILFTMDYFKSLIITLLLLSSPFYCAADDLVWHEGKKEDIFKMAKDQDKFVLAILGSYTCGQCNRAKTWFNGSLKTIVDNNYFTWFVVHDSDIYKTLSQYTAEYDALLMVIGKPWPIILIVNPDDTDDFIIFWPPDSRNEQIMRQKITPPGLLSFSQLTWYENKEEVFKLAKEQGKYILKFVGRATSPQSKKMMKQFNENPLRDMLEGNYILWYSSDMSEAKLEAGAAKTLPYLSVIYPEDPDNLLEEEWGYKDNKTLEELFKNYTVSNDNIQPKDKAFVSGNILYISNQTSNEQIRIYSLTGQSFSTVRKNDFSIRIDVSNLPKGIFVIHSSAGWSAKVLKQ